MALLFMQKNRSSMFPDEETDIKKLLNAVLDELPEEKKATMRAEAGSLSLLAITDIVLEATQS